jgi:hypothetical protein
LRGKKEGVPPVPQVIAAPDEERPPAYDDDIPEGLYANPSDSVIEAAEEVKIVESRLRKRRLEREAEEVEDWFRDRERRQADEEAAEQQRAEAARAVQRRREWMQGWTRHALDSLLTVCRERRSWTYTRRWSRRFEGAMPARRMR